MQLKHLIRSLFRRPGLSLMIIGMLTLAIGANSAIYSVAKAVVLTPLPFRDPDRVVQIFEGGDHDVYQPAGENYFSSVRAATFQDWREQCHSFESIVAGRNVQLTIGADRPFVADALLASDGFFDTLGVAPRLGRYFDAEDYAPRGSPVVVLSHRLWTERYNADSSIVGRDILIDGVATRVTGVMPQGFYPARGVERQLWLPLRWDPANKYNPTLWGLFIYARLKPGVTLEQAQTEMSVVAGHTRAAYPNFYDRVRGVVVPSAGYTFGQHERLFWLLLGSVGLVLLIACANIANLMLARSLARQREFVVRAALGASRAAILKQVLAESMILSGAGGILGVLLGPVLTYPALALLPAASRIPRLDSVEIDANVLIFTLLISIISGLLFGIAPGLRAGSAGLSAGMNWGGRGSSPGQRERRLTDALVLAEVALSVVLLAGAGLLGQAFLNLVNRDPGFEPAHAVAAQLSVPAYRYGTYVEGAPNLIRQRLYDRLERGLQASAGVEAAGISWNLPLRHLWNPGALNIEGRPAPPPEASRGAANLGSGLPRHGSIAMQRITPGYFSALGIPLLRGRWLNDRDRPEAPMAALINETAARKFFPNEDPIGQRITVDMTSYFPKMEIVGLVGDSRMNGMDREIAPQVFWPMAYAPSANGWIVVRSKAGTDAVADSIRTTLRKIDPDVTILEVASMTGVLGDSLWRQRFAALLVGFFAILAALIAAGGMYAVISHSVARQTRELGVRVALGATRMRIASTVLARGVGVTLTGIGVGSVLSVAASRLLASQMPELKDSPWMLAAVSAFLLMLTLLACVTPVRKALGVDPITALRSD